MSPKNNQTVGACAILRYGRGREHSWVARESSWPVPSLCARPCPDSPRELRGNSFSCFCWVLIVFSSDTLHLQVAFGSHVLLLSHDFLLLKKI